MLRISNLTVQFNTFKAIDNLSFSLLKGEILGIVGESGSGKSLTALSIMQLLPPNAFQSGKIEFGEQLESDLSLLSELEMQKIRGNEIAMIFQDPLSALNSSQTIGCQMTESVRVHQNVSKKEAQKQVFTLLEKVKLDPPTRFFKSYPFQLSGGQRQRILIAMALSNSPKLLIADEPTTALDVTVQKEIVDLLKGLVQQEKIVMIFISHDLALVSQIADSVLVMNSGKMVEKEVTSLLISKPKEAYTKALLKCKPTLGHEKRRLPEVSDITNSVQFDATQQPLVQNNIGEKELLRVNDLQVVFGSKRAQNRVTAVDSVSFSLFQGETLGLVGESGCGKTTLSRALLNLIHQTGGAIYLDAQPLDIFAKDRLQFSKEIQIIFQDPFSSLNPIITIGKALNETIHIHNPKKSKQQCKTDALHWLQKVGLDDSFYNRLPRELSGGQRQRIVIARALIPEPKILICDEAVSALDVSVQARVLNLLNDLKHELGLTYIFISHDLAVVKYMSNRLAIMQEGKIVEIGESEKVYKSPQNDYSKRLINSIPEFI